MFNKKLLFAGCSFTAGDALVWDDFAKNILSLPIEWNSKEMKLYYPDYTDYRKKFNLSGKTSSLLDTESVDLSNDGNSNTGIALSVLNFLMNLSLAEQQQYHVCVGWTSWTRRLKYLKEDNTFLSLNPHHYKNPDYENVKDYIGEILINNSVYDHALQYIIDILLLENYLKYRDISYTFYRSVDSNCGWPTYDEIKKSLIGVKNKTLIPLDNISSNKNWMPFGDESDNHMFGKSWSEFKTVDLTISKKNQHPNLRSVNLVAEKLSQFIKSQFLN